MNDFDPLFLSIKYEIINAIEDIPKKYHPFMKNCIKGTRPKKIEINRYIYLTSYFPTQNVEKILSSNSSV